MTRNHPTFNRPYVTSRATLAPSSPSCSSFPSPLLSSPPPYFFSYVIPPLILLLLLLLLLLLRLLHFHHHHHLLLLLMKRTSTKGRGAWKFLGLAPRFLLRIVPLSFSSSSSSLHRRENVYIILRRRNPLTPFSFSSTSFSLPPPLSRGVGDSQSRHYFLPRLRFRFSFFPSPPPSPSPPPLENAPFLMFPSPFHREEKVDEKDPRLLSLLDDIRENGVPSTFSPYGGNLFWREFPVSATANNRYKRSDKFIIYSHGNLSDLGSIQQELWVRQSLPSPPPPPPPPPPCFYF